MLSSSSDLLSTQCEEILDNLGGMALSIHQQPNMDAILEFGVTAVRDLFKCDRTLVYHFLPAGDGVVLAEFVGVDTPAIVGQLIYDPCFKRHWIERYRQGRTSSIDHVEASHLAPCHIELLTQLQVKANLVAPIILPITQAGADTPLWGLLIVHECHQPRTWQPIHHQVLKHIGTQIGIALYHDQMRQALTQSQQRETRWQTALEAAEDGVWDWNVATNEVSFSREWKAMLGYAEDEIGNSLAEWESQVHPDDLAQVYTAIQHHFAGHSPLYKSEHRVQAKDGSWHWILDRGKVVEWKSDGSPLRVVGTHVDITAHKQMEQQLRDRDEMLRKISEQVPGVVYQYRLYSGGESCFPYASEAIRYIYEVTPEQVRTTAQPVLDRLHPDDCDRVLASISHSFHTLELWHDEYRVCLPNRGLRWLEGHALPEQLEDGSVLWHGYIWDITERKQMEAIIAREVQQERMITLIDHRIGESLDLETILHTTVEEVRQFLETDRVLIYRLQLDERGIVMAESVAPEWLAILSYEITDSCFVETPGGSPHDNHVKVVNDIYTVGFSARHIERLEWMQVKAKLVVPILQGDQLWGLLIAHHCQEPRQWQASESRLLQQLANQLALAIHKAEIHHHLQAVNQELEYLSNTDALTQVSNRRCFDQNLIYALHQAQWINHPLALILCDIDYFKQYNDTYGHPAGDACLVKVAHVLQQCLKRPGDSLARYGGEEFAIILPNTDLSGAIAVVQDMQCAIAALALEHTTHPHSAWVTLSFGITSLMPNYLTSPQTLISQADQALYKAKELGRNCYALFSNG